MTIFPEPLGLRNYCQRGRERGRRETLSVMAAVTAQKKARHIVLGAK